MSCCDKGVFNLFTFETGYGSAIVMEKQPTQFNGFDYWKYTPAYVDSVWSENWYIWRTGSTWYFGATLGDVPNARNSLPNPPDNCPITSGWTPIDFVVSFEFKNCLPAECCENIVFSVSIETSDDFYKIAFTKAPDLYNGFPYWISEIEPAPGIVLYLYAATVQTDMFDPSDLTTPVINTVDFWLISPTLGSTLFSGGTTVEEVWTYNYLFNDCPNATYFEESFYPEDYAFGEWGKKNFYQTFGFNSCAVIPCDKYVIEWGRDLGSTNDPYGIYENGNFSVAEFSGYYFGNPYYTIYEAFGSGLNLNLFRSDFQNTWYLSSDFNLDDLWLAYKEDSSGTIPCGELTITDPETTAWTDIYGDFPWTTMNVRCECLTECPCLNLEIVNTVNGQTETIDVKVAGVYEDGINPGLYNYYEFTFLETTLFLYYVSGSGWVISPILGSDDYETVIYRSGYSSNPCPENNYYVPVEA